MNPKKMRNLGVSTLVVAVICVVITAIVVGAGTYMVAGQGGGQGGGPAGPTYSYKPPTEKTITLGKSTWPFWEPYVHVLEIMLQKMGYEVDSKDIGDSWSLGLESTTKGEIQVLDQASDVCHTAFNKKYYKPKHDLIWYSAIGTGQFQGWKVPSYVYEAGVHSIKDLKKDSVMKKFKEKGDGLKVTGIGAGAGLMGLSDKVLTEYGLKDKGWEIVEGSTAAMVSDADSTIKNHEWGIFLWWDPFYATVKHPDMKYLKDPKGILQGTREQQYFVVRKDFPSKYPLAAKFMRNFYMTKKSLYKMTEWKTKENLSIKEAAEKWVRTHWRNWQWWFPYPYKIGYLDSAPSDVYAKVPVVDEVGSISNITKDDIVLQPWYTKK